MNLGENLMTNFCRKVTFLDNVLLGENCAKVCILIVMHLFLDMKCLEGLGPNQLQNCFNGPAF